MCPVPNENAKSEKKKPFKREGVRGGGKEVLYTGG